MEQEVRWLLAEKLLRVRTGPVFPAEQVANRRSTTLAAFGSTVEALRYVDAISDEESLQWRNRMWRAIGLEPPEVSAPGQIQLLYLGDGEPPEPAHSSWVPRYPRTVSGARESLEAFHGSFRIEEVEYDDSVTVIRWKIGPMPDVDAAFPELAAALEEDIAGMDGWAIEHFRTKSREALRRSRVPLLDLEDDVGTEYREHPVQREGAAEIKGITAFTPGTPSHAKHLVVHWLGSSLKVDL